MLFRYTRCLAPYVLLVLVGCSRGEPGQIVDGKVIVTADRVTVEEKKPILSFAAVLTPSAKVLFRFPFDAKVGRVATRLGAKVVQGDLLFELDEADLALKLATLKASAIEKKSLSDKNAYFLENRDRLLGEGKIDQTQYNSLEAEANAAKAAYDHLQAQAAEMGNQISDNLVRAPMDGIVAELSLVSGAKISTGETVLSLVRIDPIDVSFEIPAEEASGIAPDMPVDIKIEGLGEKALPSTITFVNPELDAASKMLTVKASLDNKDYNLKGGMQAQVTFQSQRPQKILSLPLKALLTEGDKAYVYLVKENKVWPVRIFTRNIADNPDWVEVQAGLKENDLVVTEGQKSLNPGVGVNLWR